MIKRLKRFWKSGWETAANQAGQAPEQTCAGRVISTLTYIVVIICLGLWITVFLVLKDQLVAQTVDGSILTNLTCILFFVGLIMALFIGALAGNFLRRFFWKMLVKHYK